MYAVPFKLLYIIIVKDGSIPKIMEHMLST